MSDFSAFLRIRDLPIIFTFKVLLIIFQVGRCCRHKFITGKKWMPCILRFLRIFYVANISYFLILSMLSFFLIYSELGVKFFFLYNVIFCSHKLHIFLAFPTFLKYIKPCDLGYFKFTWFDVF